MRKRRRFQGELERAPALQFGAAATRPVLLGRIKLSRRSRGTTRPNPGKQPSVSDHRIVGPDQTLAWSATTPLESMRPLAYRDEVILCIGRSRLRRVQSLLRFWDRLRLGNLTCDPGDDYAKAGLEEWMLGSCWETLANFESFELVKREYARRHGRTPNSAHARELAAPFTHARSYFTAALGADRTVKPLLLYYGVLSLSRGLTLALSRSKREAALGASHGLSIKDWGVELSKPNPDFARIEVGINASGSFVEVCNATANKSLLRGGSSAVNLTYSSGLVATGLKLSLGDVLARVPRLQEHFWRWQAATTCYPLVVSNSELQFPKNRPGCDRALCELLLAGTAFQFASETASHVAFHGPNSLAALPGMSDKVSTAMLGIGELWL